MPSIRDQMELYYRLDLSLDPEDTVFAIWTGVNDIQKTYQQAPGKVIKKLHKQKNLA